MEPYSITAQACIKANGISNYIALIIGTAPIGLTIINALIHAYKITYIYCYVISEKLDRGKAIGAEYII